MPEKLKQNFADYINAFKQCIQSLDGIPAARKAKIQTAIDNLTFPEKDSEMKGRLFLLLRTLLEKYRLLIIQKNGNLENLINPYNTAIIKRFEAKLKSSKKEGPEEKPSSASSYSRKQK